MTWPRRPVPADELVDLRDPAFVADPYPRLAELRAQAPVVWHDGLGSYLATSHAACHRVLRSRDLGRTFDPRQPESDYATFNWLHADAMLENEPPRHTRLRRLVAGAFGRGHVARLQPRVEELAEGLLTSCTTRLATDGSFDVIADYAELLPVLVIAELLGWPEPDRHLLRPWSQAMVKMYEIDRSPSDERLAEQASQEFAGYLDGLAAHRAAHPREDLLSDLVTVRDGSDRLSGRELVATAVLLLNAGHEASVNGFGNGLAAMLATGGPRRAAPVGSTVEEMLRHDSPLQLFERTAVVDTEIGGTLLRRGDRVAALLGAANRDPAVFREPDSFDPDREPNPHLAFGAGIHFCLGAPLARLELQTGLSVLLARFPRLEIVSASRRPTFVLRGYQQLLVRPR